jgi:hypothetical protein
MSQIDCRDVGSAAMLYAAAHGTGPATLDRFNPGRACMGPAPRDWPNARGSRNYAPPFWSVLGDVRSLAQLARHFRTEEWWSRELDSGLYTSCVLVAFLLGLRDAKGEDEEEIRLFLRAFWAMSCLRAVPVTPQRFAIHGPNGDGKVKPHPDAAIYRAGCWLAMAGDRFNAAAILGSSWPPIVAWAVDLERRHRRILNNPIVPRDLADLPRWSASGQGWFEGPHVVGLLGGSGGRAASYETRLSPELFGLTEQERAVLQRVVHGDVQAATEALAWVRGVRVAPQRKLWSLVRTTLGASAQCSRTLNSNKPGVTDCRISTGGLLEAVMPSVFKKTGAAPATAERTAAGVVSRGSGGEYTLPHLEGEVLWRLDITHEGLVATGELPAAGPGPSLPSPPPRPGRPPTATKPRPRREKPPATPKPKPEPEPAWPGVAANHTPVSSPELNRQQCRECYLGRQQHGAFAVKAAEESQRPGLVPRRAEGDKGRKPPASWGVNSAGRPRAG